MLIVIRALAFLLQLKKSLNKMYGPNKSKRK